MFILVIDGTPLGCLLLQILFEVALLPRHRDLEYGIERFDELAGIYYEYVEKVYQYITDQLDQHDRKLLSEGFREFQCNTVILNIVISAIVSAHQGIPYPKLYNLI